MVYIHLIQKLTNISRGPHGRRDDGVSIGDGNDEDDRQARQHHQLARMLHTRWTALRHRRVRSQRQPKGVPEES